MNINMICLEDEVFYVLVEEVYQRLKEKEKTEDLWVNADEAMRLLNIKSQTTLQKLRDEEKIRFTQPQPRKILYYRPSLNEYLEKYAKETF